MEVTAASTFEIGETTQTGEARRGAMAIAREAGLDEVEAGRVGIVVTEAASNMVKHASGGWLLVQPLQDGPRRGIVSLALDRGPGMKSVGERMRDGFSTSGTPGTGLGAIARQATEFDVYSRPGHGTALLAVVWARGVASSHTDSRIGGVCVPVRGESQSGDGWSIEHGDGRIRVMLTDGLGHGPLAYQASSRAAAVFRDQAARPLEEIVQRLHEELRPTRGAAVAIADIDPARHLVRFCGVGNIVGRIFSETGDKHLVSMFGTIGHDVRKIQPFQQAWPPRATLVLHSDGLGTHWKLDDYPGLAMRHAALIAGVLFRDHARGRDDCTVVVARDPS